MYLCPKCETRYDLTDKHYKYISDQCNQHSMVETLVICPKCHSIHIVGGESDVDLMTGESCIMMFGKSFNQYQALSEDRSALGLMAFEGEEK